MKLYHVYNRGNHKGAICFDSMDLCVLQKMFIDLFRLEKRNGIVSLCLMPNHYHLLVSVSKEKHLSVAMRDIGRNYTVYMNRKYGLVGRIFQGPYKKRLVDNFIYFRTLTQYLRNNPKELKYKKHLTKIVENKGLVEYYDFLLTTKEDL